MRGELEGDPSRTEGFQPRNNRGYHSSITFPRDKLELGPSSRSFIYHKATLMLSVARGRH